MGLFGGLGDILFGSPAESKPVQIPGIYSRPQAQQFANLAAQLLGVQFDPEFFGGGAQQGLGGIGGNIFNSGWLSGGPSTGSFGNKQLLSLSGGVGAPNLDPATLELVNQAMAARQGQFNALGIGASPAAQYGVAAAAAPTLADYRNMKIAQLLQLAGYGVPQVAQKETGATPGASSLIPSVGLTLK